MSNMSRPTRPGRCTWAIAAARWSATALASLLEAAGFRVTKEYYVNDAGGQVDTLARSLHLRYREALGEEIGEIPEGLYPGDYLVPVGAALAAEYGDAMSAAPEEAMARDCSASAPIAAMLDLIRHDLGAARHPPRHFRVRGRASGVGRGRDGDGRAARQGPRLRRRARAAQEPRRRTTSGSRSS